MPRALDGLMLSALTVLAGCGGITPDAAVGDTSPAAAVEELLVADRAFSQASMQTDLISGISAMLAPDVIVPAPGGVFLEGIEPVRHALGLDSLNAASRAEWFPVRGGISADGLHGFTFGYMKVHRPDSTITPYKYLAYWVRRPEGWRVQAFRRGGASHVVEDRMPPAMPPAMTPPVTDANRIAELRESLAEAERSFSRDAQSTGLGPAFARYGNDDAVNMGAPDGPWVVGVDAVAAAVGGDQPNTSSPVSWGPDHRVIVASSGDLGITFGFIRQNAPQDPARPPFAFFTIWQRPDTVAPWRYIAE